MKRSILLGVVLVACAAGAGCRTAPATSVAAPQADAGPAPVALAERVARVRAMGGELDVIEVSPLREAQLADLREAATAAELRGDLAAASAHVDQARSLAPDEPELLQLAAELALLQGDLDQAVVLAERSFQLGPRLGALCRRNWATVREAQEAHGNDTGVEAAQAWLGTCAAPAPVRM